MLNAFPQRIILTGATGYLGRHLLDRLIKDGHYILCPVHPDILYTDAFQHQHVQSVNTQSTEYVSSIINFKADAVINTAGVYDRQGNSISKLTEGNIVFPLHLLNVLLDNNAPITQVINICTSMPKQFNAYTESKHQFAHWGRVYSDRCGITFSNIKLEHFYGAFDNNIKFIQFVIEKLFANEPIDLTSGHQKRDFIHISDVINGLICVLNGNLRGYTDIPLGSGVSASVRSVVEYMKDKINSTSKLNFGTVKLRENEPMNLVANLELMKALGFTPKYDWRSGLLEVIHEVRKKQ